MRQISRMSATLTHRLTQRQEGSELRFFSEFEFPLRSSRRYSLQGDNRSWHLGSAARVKGKNVRWLKVLDGRRVT